MCIDCENPDWVITCWAADFDGDDKRVIFLCNKCYLNIRPYFNIKVNVWSRDEWTRGYDKYFAK